MTQTWKTHTIGQDDTVESVAARYLGRASRWREIATLNKLRSPFISAKPADWFGPTQAIGLLPDEVATGGYGLALPGERPEFLPSGGVFFIDGYDEDGQYLYEALPIASYDGNTLALYEPFRYAWRAGTRWLSFGPQRESHNRVARPGETIMLPIPFGEIGATLLTDADFITLYGTDIELRPGPRGGALIWVDGDLAVVRGRDNIKQALRFRADLPFGTNIFHPEEGNQAHLLIGEGATPSTLLRARGYTRYALGTDPRVVEVPEVTARTGGDGVIEIAASVVLANNPNAVRVSAIILMR